MIGAVVVSVLGRFRVIPVGVAAVDIIPPGPSVVGGVVETKVVLVLGYLRLRGIRYS